jgi:hypothetical protein
MKKIVLLFFVAFVTYPFIFKTYSNKLESFSTNNEFWLSQVHATMLNPAGVVEDSSASATLYFVGIPAALSLSISFFMGICFTVMSVRGRLDRFLSQRQYFTFSVLLPCLLWLFIIATFHYTEGMPKFPIGDLFLGTYKTTLLTTLASVGWYGIVNLITGAYTLFTTRPIFYLDE